MNNRIICPSNEEELPLEYPPKPLCSDSGLLFKVTTFSLLGAPIRVLYFSLCCEFECLNNIILFQNGQYFQYKLNFKVSQS
jgi:hypothetical protein